MLPQKSSHTKKGKKLKIFRKLIEIKKSIHITSKINPYEKSRKLKILRKQIKTKKKSDPKNRGHETENTPKTNFRKIKIQLNHKLREKKFA